ncbi:hypothetical protein CR103_18915 [Massilia psychrophila]|uniref:Uncharacterized protein n=1 Tax=Massilia psychrophila TaxID=1603353 RepID=A0A2G8SWW3_9BURK|nr:hypothetical protein CR103_18915 [Massilia psychrophila]
MKAPLDRIAEDDAVITVPERHRVPEAFGESVRRQQAPGNAAVVGAVDARRRAGTCTHHQSGLGVDAVDVAKVERVGAGHLDCLPVDAVDRAQHGALRAAGPGYRFADDRQAAQLSGHAAVFKPPGLLGKGGARRKNKRQGQ